MPRVWQQTEYRRAGHARAVGLYGMCIRDDTRTALISGKETPMNGPQTKEYRRLKRAGFDLDTHPTFAFNGGSESIKHAFAKLVSAYVGLQNEWCVDCEVSCPNGTMDVVWYAPDKLNLVIEVESDATDDIIADKRAQYVRPFDCIDDLHWIEVTDLHPNVFDMRDSIITELGLF